MAEKLILYSKRDHVGYITLNNPETGNRIDLQTAQELADVCTQINGDEEVYLVVFTGSESSFCSGGDVWQLVGSGGNAELPVKYNPAEAIASIDRPVLAAINGDAIGEGLEMALACDIRIAVEDAHFGLPQIVSGAIPMDGGTQRLARLVGKGKALELVLTGEIISAQQAFEIALVNKVVNRDSWMPEMEILIKTLVEKAPLAMRFAKEAVNKGLDLTLDQGLRLEADLYFLLHTTADRTEGITSFLRKRKPEYKGK